MEKAAGVRLIQAESNDWLGVVLKVQGDVSAVAAAIDAGKHVVTANKEVMAKHGPEILIRAAARGVHIICQKPLAPTLAESRRIVENAESAGVRFMVHENFRWQPWYREAKRLTAPPPEPGVRF